MSESSTLAGRLRHAREKAGISQRELGKRAGISEGHPGLIESGEIKNPAGTTLVHLANALGCDLRWLAEGSGEAFPEPCGGQHAESENEAAPGSGESDDSRGAAQ